MKKISAILLSLAMLLSLCACKKTVAAEPATPDTSVPSNDMSIVDSSVAPEEADSSADASLQTTEPVEPEPEPAPEPAAQDAVPVLSIERTEGEKTASDGTVLLTHACDKVTVSIPGNEAAQAAIQADLDALAQSFTDGLEKMTDEAQYIYEQSNTDSSAGIQDYMYTFSDELSVTIARCDERVISLVISEVGYSGGAHGWDSRYTRNYDAQTGQRLAFADLGGDAFVSAGKEAVLSQAAAMQAEQETFFEGYEGYIDEVFQDGTSTAEEVYGEGMGDDIIQPTFYFNDEGVVFISGEYVMQPYVAGIIEFTVPYEELSGVLPEAYAK